MSDFIRFSREMGFQSVVVSKSLKNAVALPYYARLLTSWKHADILLTVYPYFCYPTFRSNPLRAIDERLIRYLHASTNRIGSILYVVDLPIEQILSVQMQASVDKKAHQIEREVFQSFDILCVYNSQMKRFIIDRYDVSHDKFVEFEILDHGTAVVPPSEKTIGRSMRKIAYTGNWTKQYVGEWVRNLPKAENITYEFTGMNWGWISDLGRSDVVNKGFMSDEGLLCYISVNADFGIIEMPLVRKEYSNYGSTSKFGTYVAAGLPILVSSDCTYIASLVRKYGIGLLFNSLSEIPALIQNLSASEYGDMRRHCLELGQKLRTGYFFKQAVTTSLHKLSLLQPDLPRS